MGFYFGTGNYTISNYEIFQNSINIFYLGHDPIIIHPGILQNQHMGIQSKIRRFIINLSNSGVHSSLSSTPFGLLFSSTHFVLFKTTKNVGSPLQTMVQRQIGCAKATINSFAAKEYISTCSIYETTNAGS